MGETAFVIDPFVLESCDVDYQCRATCVNNVKTRVKAWDCTSEKAVRDIIVKRTVLPRCEATCNTCPAGRWAHDSFRPCNVGASEVSHSRQCQRLVWSVTSLLLTIFVLFQNE